MPANLPLQGTLTAFAPLSGRAFGIDVDANSFRGQYLASLFSGKIIDLKQFRRLRNHLEHFDERLDMWVKNFSGHAFFDMNIMTDAKGFPTKAFLRAMDGYIFRFHGEDYDLQALHSGVNPRIETTS